METVTSFSASLLQSLGNDTQAAAEKADMAVIDMADNANKMGTDIESIQNAYSGFAKKNYTMLDNLKLGYGGTKEEMERLLADANALNKAQGKYTDYSVESFADMVDAIHVVQTSMGITGTTAKEAATTIQGSVNSAKAAWHNLLIGVSDDNQDFDRLVDEFVDSIYTAADNILPRVSTSLDGILKLVNVAAKKILPSVIQEISEQLPTLIDTGADIVIALGEGIVNNLDAILGAAEKVIKKVVPKLATAFKEIVPKIAKSAKDIIKELNGVVETVGGVYLAFKSLTKGNWIGVGIGLVVAAYGLLEQSAADARKEIMNLTDSEWDMIAAGQEAADALYTAVDARNDNIDAIEIETKATQDLWAELQTLVDENGNVIKGNEERVDYILGDLNDALGTEYQRNGEIIAQYQTMQEEIDKLIQKRRAERLIENGEEAYSEALVGRDANLSTVTARSKALDNAQRKYEEELAEETRLNEEFKNDWNNVELSIAVAAAKTRREAAEGAVEEAQAKYDDAVNAANEAVQTITQYEQAYAAFQQGNYEDAAALMEKDTIYRWQHVSDVKTISAEERQQLKEDLEAKRYAMEAAQEGYKKGAEGYTKEMVEDLQSEVDALSALWEEANAEAAGARERNKAAIEAAASQFEVISERWTETAEAAIGAGENVALGFAQGMEAQAEVVEEKGRQLAARALNAMQMAAEIASPSKATRRFGRFMGEGLALGIEDETGAVVKRASGLMNSALGTMSGQTAGSASAAISGNGGAVAAPVSISINVRADTDDLGSKIASELQVVLDDILAARGNIYRNGRTNYAY